MDNVLVADCGEGPYSFVTALQHLKAGYVSGRKERREQYDPMCIVFRQEGYPDGVEHNEATRMASGISASRTVCRPYLMACLRDSSLAPLMPSYEDLIANGWNVLFL